MGKWNGRAFPAAAFFAGGLVAGVLIANSVSPKQRNSSGHTAVPSSITVENPGSLQDSVDSWEKSDTRISLRTLRILAENDARQNPEKAILEADQIPGHDNREAYFGTLLTAWGGEEGIVAAKWAQENLEGEQLSDALYYVADGWAEEDPRAAGEWFLETTDGVIRSDALWEVLESWGRKEPAEAFRWAEKLDEETRFEVMDGLAEGWGAVDPEAAISAGETLLSTDYGYEFLVSVTTQWAGLDPAAASKWASSIRSEILREGVLMELGETWAQTTPGEAVEWVGTIADPGSRRFAESGVAIGWSEYAPADALEWAIESVGEEAHLNEMITDIVFNWANLDPGGTTEWLETTPDGEGKDKVLQAFSAAVVADSPSAAVSWAKTISSDQTRESHMEALLNSWIQMEGRPAVEQIRSLDLPDELVGRVFQAYGIEP